MKKIAIIVMSLVVLFAIPRVGAAYNYSPLMDVISSAEALIVNQVIDSSNLVDQNLDHVHLEIGELVDVEVYEDQVFLVDKKLNRIIVLDENFHFKTTFPEANAVQAAKLNSPSGIFITKNNIYIADTNNLRVAIFDKSFNFKSEIKQPDDPTFKTNPESTEGYDFKPLKIAVDRSERVYVVADQIYEGIIDFNPDGTFSRYVGANTVRVSAWDAFWLLFTSEAQRKAQGYRLATTFVNLNIDQDNYLYTVSSSSEGTEVIKKLNYKGKDVLTRNGYFPQNGDITTISGRVKVPTGPSELIDIDVNDYGSYSVLDRTRGRIFTYDFEGNLLYVGGQLGNIGGVANNQSSLFLKPEALTYYGDYILVVDSLNKNLVVMEYTPFAKLVNQATYHYYHGEYDKAREVWEEVLVLNTNYYLAYAGIGKAQLRDGNYNEAMENLKIGYDDANYSKAYQKYRYDKLMVISPYIIGAGLVLVVVAFVLSIRTSVRKEREEEKSE